MTLQRPSLGRLYSATKCALLAVLARIPDSCVPWAEWRSSKIQAPVVTAFAGVRQAREIHTWSVMLRSIVVSG